MVLCDEVTLDFEDDKHYLYVQCHLFTEYSVNIDASSCIKWEIMMSELQILPRSFWFINVQFLRFGSHVEMEMLSRDLSYLVEVKDGLISLTPLQLCARDIEVVLGDVGKLPVAELESQYEAKFGRELPLEPLGFESVSELLAAMNDTLSVSGRGIRSILSY